MLLKVVALFLIFMLVMASVQKLFRGGRLPGPGHKRSALDKLRCATCRRIQISANPGPCGRPDCEYR
jgi:hypothetical protein